MQSSLNKVILQQTYVTKYNYIWTELKLEKQLTKLELNTILILILDLTYI